VHCLLLLLQHRFALLYSGCWHGQHWHNWWLLLLLLHGHIVLLHSTRLSIGVRDEDCRCCCCCRAHCMLSCCCSGCWAAASCLTAGAGAASVAACVVPVHSDCSRCTPGFQLRRMHCGACNTTAACNITTFTCSTAAAAAAAAAVVSTAAVNSAAIVPTSILTQALS
jgi:hypothetical protein